VSKPGAAEVEGAVATSAAGQRFDDHAERRFEAMRTAIAERRRALGMSMSELARAVGISPSMVSQIERGQALPSVATLFALVAALGEDVDAFFWRPEARPTEQPQRQQGGGRRAGDTAPEPGTREGLYVVRRRERETIDIHGGIRWERLTPRPLETLEFLELVYPPKAESDESLYRHPGTEMVLVLEGRFEIHIGFERYVLDPGDSIEFPSSLPHRYVNPTDATSRAATVILHDPPHPREPDTSSP
jgi:transcriptional regulator with XRE-family HTH domain